MLKTVKRMVIEEWRTQSELYRGRNLALLPAIIFLITLAGTWAALNYSDTSIVEITALTTAFGFFTGLAAGAINFSGKDALENVLGSTSFIIYSSRTLPVKETTLFTSFVIKDVIYYFSLYLLPVAAAIIVVTGYAALNYVIFMFAAFILGLLLSMAVAQVPINLPRKKLLNYRSAKSLTPLTRKSILDISRSSGGLLKIVFSFSILLGFYWYVVFNFPAAEYLLFNPLLSFAVISGMMSVTVYNWLNTYDKLEDYNYLPVNREKLLKSKIQAFKASALLILTGLILASYYFYPGNLLLAFILAYVTAYYTVAVTAYTAGLNPNEKMMDSKTFMKFLVITNLAVIPLLALTAFAHSLNYMLALTAAMLLIGRFLLWRAFSK